MVFSGSSTVAAAGAEVEVPSGMGSTVPEGAPPSPPETLLPRPELVSPALGADLAWANPTLAWRPVAGASRAKRPWNSGRLTS